jgi:hypothetical protein
MNLLRCCSTTLRHKRGRQVRLSILTTFTTLTVLIPPHPCRYRRFQLHITCQAKGIFAHRILQKCGGRLNDVLDFLRRVYIMKGTGGRNSRLILGYRGRLRAEKCRTYAVGERVGCAEWHSEGQGFESPQLHSSLIGSRSFSHKYFAGRPHSSFRKAHVWIQTSD